MYGQDTGAKVRHSKSNDDFRLDELFYTGSNM